MQHSISCVDAGVNCPFVAHDETISGVLQQINDHVQSVHGEIVKQLLETMSPDELTEWLKEKIKTKEDTV